MPNGKSDASGYRGCDHRLYPLGGKVRPARKDIADEGNYRADRHLPSNAINRPIHLRYQGNGNYCANDATNRGDADVLKAECGPTTRHYEKAGKPGTCELFSGRAGKAGRKRVIGCLSET